MSLSHHVAQNGFKSMLTAVRPVQFCSNYWFTTVTTGLLPWKDQECLIQADLI